MTNINQKQNEDLRSFFPLPPQKKIPKTNKQNFSQRNILMPLIWSLRGKARSLDPCAEARHFLRTERHTNLFIILCSPQCINQMCVYSSKKQVLQIGDSMNPIKHLKAPQLSQIHYLCYFIWSYSEGCSFYRASAVTRSKRSRMQCP